MPNRRKSVQKKQTKSISMKDRLGVRITVEFEGHVLREEVEPFLQRLKGVIVEDVEDGPGG